VIGVDVSCEGREWIKEAQQRNKKQAADNT